MAKDETSEKDSTVAVAPSQPVTEEGQNADPSGDATEAAQPQAPETSSDDTQSDEDKKFREDQKRLASEQNLTAEDAVPEQRPIASQTVEHSDDALTKQIKERSDTDDGPMGKAAYDAASSDSQRDKASQSERHEGLKVGDVVLVHAGPHEGRYVAVTRIEAYRDSADLAVANAGIPEGRFIQPKRIEGRARGDSRDGEVLILDVEEADLRKTHWMGTGRG